MVQQEPIPEGHHSASDGDGPREAVRSGLMVLRVCCGEVIRALVCSGPGDSGGWEAICSSPGRRWTVSYMCCHYSGNVGLRFLEV